MNATGYAFEFQGHGVFTPEGRTDMTPDDVAAHNAQLEAAELEQWQLQPDRWHCYVTNAHHNCGTVVTTWQGKPLGTIIGASMYRNNLGARITCIRVRGNNGATYYGRYGSDWSQLCRLRKVNGKG